MLEEWKKWTFIYSDADRTIKIYLGYHGLPVWIFGLINKYLLRFYCAVLGSDVGLNNIYFDIWIDAWIKVLIHGCFHWTEPNVCTDGKKKPPNSGYSVYRIRTEALDFRFQSQHSGYELQGRAVPHLIRWAHYLSTLSFWMIKHGLIQIPLFSVCLSLTTVQQRLKENVLYYKGGKITFVQI